MKTLGIVANCSKKRAPVVLERLAGKAKDAGLRLLADETTGALLDGCSVMALDRVFDEADAVMALGGDGTMLRVVRELQGRNKPVLGLNIGSLGFLTSVSEEDLDRALECLAAGTFTVMPQQIVEGVVEQDGSERARYRALNEVVVSSGPSTRVMTLGVSVDGDLVTSYVCDGLIVSTPAGSTGHSLSAGGPIVTPSTCAFVISLICPHTLSSRPLVVPDASEIRLTVEASAGDVLLSVDGQVGQALAQSDAVRIRKAARGVRFIHLPGYSYFSVLRQKLHWSGSNV